MLIRFFHISATLVVTILGCSDPILNTNARDKAPTATHCPDLHLKHSSLSVHALETLKRTRPSPVPRAAGLTAIVVPMVRDGGTSTKQRLVLKRAALRFAQQTTLKHFMDYGRLLAHSAISPSKPNGVIEHPLNLDPQSLGAFFGALVDSPPPRVSVTTTRDRTLRYILYMWSWVGLLDDRVQLEQWWHPWEYRWILEARVLGHFGLSITDRLKANTALKNTNGYPHDWNTAVLNIWAQNHLSAAMRDTLSSVVPTACMKHIK